MPVGGGGARSYSHQRFPVIVISSTSDSESSDCIVLEMGHSQSKQELESPLRILKRNAEESENLESAFDRAHLSSSCKKVGYSEESMSSPPTPIRRHRITLPFPSSDELLPPVADRAKDYYFANLKCPELRKFSKKEHSSYLHSHLQIYLDQDEVEAALDLIALFPDQRPRLETVKQLFGKLWTMDDALKLESVYSYLETLSLPLNAENLWGWSWIGFAEFTNFTNLWIHLLQVIREHGELAQRSITLVMRLAWLSMQRQAIKSPSLVENPIMIAQESRFESRLLFQHLFDVFDFEDSFTLQSIWAEIITMAGYLIELPLYQAAKHLNKDSLARLFRASPPHSLPIADLALSLHRRQPSAIDQDYSETDNAFLSHFIVQFPV